MSAVLKWQMFSSSTELGVANILFKRSNSEDAKTSKESLQKAGVVGEARKTVLLEQPTSLYPTRLGLREIKQCEIVIVRFGNVAPRVISWSYESIKWNSLLPVLFIA
jgi:hypothetical protein